jgi:hypothetical protein
MYKTKKNIRSDDFRNLGYSPKLSKAQSKTSSS